MKKQFGILIFATLFSINPAFAKVQLASVFSDHMVFQRGKPVPVWGTAKANEKLLIEFAGQSKKAVADVDGKWRVQLAPMNASSKPQTLWIVSPIADSRIKRVDVLVGDVWLCSGQSNMKFGLGGTLGSQEIIQASDLPNLRLLHVPQKIQREPSENISAQWMASAPGTVGRFSAVGYIFGQRIHQETGIPIGLIMCAVGSTSVESWVSNEMLSNDLFTPAIAKWREAEAAWDDPAVRKKYIHKGVKDPDVIQPFEARTYPGGCYNGMLHPLFPFAIKGVVWYQGEANMKRGFQYRLLFPAMIQEWRTRFEQDDFKFYTVQLPEIGKSLSDPGDSFIAELREAQNLAAQNDPLIEMAVIIDSDQQGNIHPKNKQLPGERLAAIALAKDYGEKIEFSGPVFQGWKTKKNAAVLSFTHLGGGLVSGKRKAPSSLDITITEDALTHFSLAGKDQVFHSANAVIEGNTVVVQSDAVSKPVAVRYAWADSPANCNFYNRAGFPAGPFRTDDWPCVSEGAVDGKVLVIR